MFQTITTRYQEFKRSGKKKCKCDVCGKSFTRQRTFTATQNPFNKNEDGSIKTPRDIYVSLDKKVAEWMDKPEKHGCEPC